MTQDQAQAFVEKAIHAWKNSEVAKADLLYTADVQGSVNGEQTFGLSDIKNRMEYLATHHQNIKYDVLDIVASGNKIGLRFRYSAFDKKLGQAFDSMISGFYTLRGDQAERVDIISSAPFNYREAV